MDEKYWLNAYMFIQSGKCQKRKKNTLQTRLTHMRSFYFFFIISSFSYVFLNGVLQEEVYMWQPKGFEDPINPHYICKLHKAIYGLKQALRVWFECLRNTLVKWDFYNTKGDTSLFIHTDSTILIIIIYEDDILVTGSTEA